jgi:hypothetical protein
MHRLVDKSVSMSVSTSRSGAVSLDVRQISPAAARARTDILVNDAGMVIPPSE